MATIAPPSDPLCLVGLKILMPAFAFGTSWAKQKYREAAWRKVMCEGVIVSFSPRGSVTEKGGKQKEAGFVDS